MDIQDLDADTVHDMIIYIYSGKVGELEGKATGLLSAAEKYDLKVTFLQIQLMDSLKQHKTANTTTSIDLFALYYAGIETNVRGKSVHQH